METGESPLQRSLARLGPIMRFGAAFIAVCMVLIAASTGATVYLGFGFSATEAIIVTLALLTAQGLYGTVVSRLGVRTAVGSQVSDLSRSNFELARQVTELSRRLSGVEGRMDAVQQRARAATDPLGVEISELSTLVRQLAETVATYEARFADLAKTELAKTELAKTELTRTELTRTPAPPEPMPVPASAPVTVAPIAVTPAPEPLAVATTPVAAATTPAAADPAPAPLAAMPVAAPPAPVPAQEPIKEPAKTLPPAASAATAVVPGEPSASAPAIAAAVADSNRADEAMLAIIRSAIDANRIDLYLQPLVTLPQRKVRYYEAMSRLRTEAGDVLLAADFIPQAQRAGLMPKIDNLVVFRCVQVVRRLLLKNRDIGLFCNLSDSTLTDDTIFPQLVEFLEANRAIAPSLVFEFKQSAIRAAGPIESESIAALAERGFRFSLDNLQDLRIEPRELSARGFRYVKVPGHLLLDPKDTAGDIHPADLPDLLGRFGIDLVAEKIDSETMVVDLLDCDVRFGQGFLFSPPRPVRAEALQGVADRGDAIVRDAAAADDLPPPALPVRSAQNERSVGANGAGAAPRTGLAQLARVATGRI